MTEKRLLPACLKFSETLEFSRVLIEYRIELNREFLGEFTDIDAATLESNLYNVEVKCTVKLNRVWNLTENEISEFDFSAALVALEKMSKVTWLTTAKRLNDIVNG